MPDEGNVPRLTVVAADIAHQATGVATRRQIIHLDKLLLVETKFFPQDLRGVSCP